MVVRRATVEDYEEDALAVAAAATRTAAASGGPGAVTASAAAARASLGDAGAAAAAAAGEVEASGGGAAAGGGGVGDRVMRYARVFLVAAVVGFKVVEWWTRIEAQVIWLFHRLGVALDYGTGVVGFVSWARVWTGGMGGSFKNMRCRNFWPGGVGWGWCTHFMRRRGLNTVDPCMPTTPGRSTSEFHRPGMHRVNQAGCAVRCSANCMKGELHPTESRL